MPPDSIFIMVERPGVRLQAQTLSEKLAVNRRLILTDLLGSRDIDGANRDLRMP
jgi:hypothetical protein